MGGGGGNDRRALIRSQKGSRRHPIVPCQKTECLCGHCAKLGTGEELSCAWNLSNHLQNVPSFVGLSFGAVQCRPQLYPTPPVGVIYPARIRRVGRIRAVFALEKKTREIKNPKVMSIITLGNVYKTIFIPEFVVRFLCHIKHLTLYAVRMQKRYSKEVVTAE